MLGGGGVEFVGVAAERALRGQQDISAFASGDIDGAQQVGGVGLDVGADGNLGPGDAQCEICGQGFLRFVTQLIR